MKIFASITCETIQGHQCAQSTVDEEDPNESPPAQVLCWTEVIAFIVMSEHVREAPKE